MHLRSRKEGKPHDLRPPVLSARDALIGVSWDLRWDIQGIRKKKGTPEVP